MKETQNNNQKLNNELRELKIFTKKHLEKLGKEGQVNEKAIPDFFNVIEKWSKDKQVYYLKAINELYS